jgi:hypothetical protein
MVATIYDGVGKAVGYVTDSGDFVETVGTTTADNSAWTDRANSLNSEWVKIAGLFGGAYYTPTQPLRTPPPQGGSGVPPLVQPKETKPPVERRRFFSDDEQE